MCGKIMQGLEKYSLWHVVGKISNHSPGLLWRSRADNNFIIKMNLADGMSLAAIILFFCGLNGNSLPWKIKNMRSNIGGSKCFPLKEQNFFTIFN